MDTQNQGLKGWESEKLEVGPDQGVGSYPLNDPPADDTQTDTGCGVNTQGVMGEGILDTEASVDKQYFWGLDIGFEKDTTVMAEGHVENGKLVIDRIIQPKPELGDGFRVPANQGL